MESWPNDADGDVFRSLHQQDFDFSKYYIIDFNIDFEDVVPEGAYGALTSAYPQAEVINKDYEDPPYIQVRLRAKVNYDYVVRVQAELTSAMKPFGGWCESWGILH